MLLENCQSRSSSHVEDQISQTQDAQLADELELSRELQRFVLSNQGHHDVLNKLIFNFLVIKVA